MDYFEKYSENNNFDDIVISKRSIMQSGLKKYLLLDHLWLISFGTAICGMFFIWNAALAYTNITGIFLIFGLMVIFYLQYFYVLMKLSIAYPFAGGPYAYARKGLGRLGGFSAGVLTNLKYVAMAAVIISYLNLFLSDVLELKYAKAIPLFIFIAVALIQCAGIKIATQLQLFATFMGLSLFFLFYLGTKSFTDIQTLLEVSKPENADGLLGAVPYVLWVFLGIDVISMNVEETKRPSLSMPKSYYLSFIAVAVCFLIILAISTRCVSYTALSNAEFPLVFVIRAVQHGDKVLLPVFSFLSIAIFISGMNGTIDGYARVSFSLARAGYFPAALGNYIQKTKAPGTATFLLSCLVVVLAEFYRQKQHDNDCGNQRGAGLRIIPDLLYPADQPRQ